MLLLASAPCTHPSAATEMVKAWEFSPTLPQTWSMAALKEEKLYMEPAAMVTRQEAGIIIHRLKGTTPITYFSFSSCAGERESSSGVVNPAEEPVDDGEEREQAVAK